MIFLLGGDGFVGSALVRACSSSGQEYAVINRRNYTGVLGQKCDVFIHAAGNSKKYLSKQDPLQDFIESVQSVRRSLVDFRFKTYVLISSAEVYPDSASPTTTSEDQGIDVHLQSPYGFHKYLAELCVRHSAPRWLILRFGGLVGPGLKKNPIYDVLNGGPLWITPESELQYMHSDRAASITLSLLKKGVYNSILNVCGRGVINLKQVMQWAGREVAVRPGSSRVRCELSLSRLSAHADLPETCRTVKEFVIAARPGHVQGKDDSAGVNHAPPLPAAMCSLPQRGKLESGTS